MNEKIITLPVDTASPKFQQDQQTGHSRITEYRKALSEAEQGLENWKPVDRALDALAAHPEAVRTLKAHGITVKKNYWDGEPVVLNKKDVYAKSWEIPVFGKEGQGRED